MKKVGIVLALCLAFAQLSAKEIININRDWRFFGSSEGSSDRARNVNLPHTWNNDALSGREDYFRGAGNYMKDIQVPLEWRNKRVFIRFAGAGTVTDLMVNGRHVGEHRGGFTAFVFELTGYLKHGEINQLWAVVNNAPRLDVLPTAGDNNVYGGIYRDVELIVAEPSHIALSHYASDGIYVHQKSVTREKAELETTVRIDGLPGRTLNVDMAVLTAEGDTAAVQSTKFKVPEKGTGSVSLPATLLRPRLWNGTLDPYMYRVTVRLTDDGLPCDEASVPLGLRFFTVDPKEGFLLNGEPYRLRGVVYYEDRASAGIALSPYQIREDLDMIAEMGANAVRAAAYPHNPEFYAECDRRGLVVWTDLPLVGRLHDRQGVYRNGRTQTKRPATAQGNAFPAVQQPFGGDVGPLLGTDAPRRRPDRLHRRAQRRDASGRPFAHDRGREQPRRADQLRHGPDRLGPHLRMEGGATFGH